MVKKTTNLRTPNRKTTNESSTSTMKRGLQDDSSSSEKPLPKDPQAPKRSKFHGGKDVNTGKTYHIFGDFALPHPETIDLLEGHRELALKWEQAFRDFSDRDFSVIQKPVDLNEGFEKFRAQEEEIWRQIGDDPGPNAYFVKPSGSLNGPLAHHLHQPSMETTNLKNGETADYSNGCLKMLMNNGYKRDHLVFDHLHRRHKESKGLQEYPKEILDSHEGWTQQIYVNMTSPVVLLYGQHVQERVLNNLGLEHTILPLWGQADGQFLVIFHEQSFMDADPRYKLRRIGIFAYHPQRLFYEPLGSPIAKKQEGTFEIISKMFPGTIPVEEGYYTKKKWMHNNDTVLKPFRQIDLGILSDTNLSLDMFSLHHEFDGDGAKQSKPTGGATTVVSAGFTFNEYPHSVTTLKEILPLAIRALRNDRRVWEDLSDLPEKVLEWLRGVKESVFPEIEVTQLADISMAAGYTTKYSVDGKLSAREGILQLMLAQQEQLQTIGGVNADLFYVKLEESKVSVKCHSCGSLFPDDCIPRWAINRPTYFYARNKRCSSKTCKSVSNTKFAVPTDPDVHFIQTKGRPRLLLKEDRPPKLDLAPFMIQPEDTPDVVECWCIRCKEHSELYNGKSRYIDEAPRWTGSLNNVLYLEHLPRCCNCRKLDRAQGRFVPVSLTIMSVPVQKVRRLLEPYRKYGILLQKLLVAQLMPSSKNYNRRKS